MSSDLHGSSQVNGLSVQRPALTTRSRSVKIVIAGGFQVGKTTTVASVSEIRPINTDAWMTERSRDADPAPASDGKATTTVAMDFGRITLTEQLVLLLFGTPGQARFWSMWDDLTRGAVGALVMVDTRQLQISFPAINYFEADSDVPYLVGINRFDGTQTHTEDQVREALQLPDHIPVISFDARDPRSVTSALIATVTHALNRHDLETRRGTR
jgi:signal recognition particle receptor subunit beta